MPYPTITSSCATPSWISRASRCRSSLVASERTSSKSSAASSRSAAGAGQRGHPRHHRRRVGAGDVRLQHHQPDRAYPGDQRHDQRRDVAAAGCERACERLAVCGCWLAQASAMAESGVERGLPVDPVHPGLGEHHQPAAAAGRQHRRPVGRGHRAQLLQQVLGDAARVQGGPGQLPGDAAQLGQQPGRLRVRLGSSLSCAAASPRCRVPAWNGRDQRRPAARRAGQLDDGQSTLGRERAADQQGPAATSEQGGALPDRRRSAVTVSGTAR